MRNSVGNTEIRSDFCALLPLKKLKMYKSILFLSLLFIWFSACRSNHENEQNPSGEIQLGISHTVDGNPLATDTLQYVNAAGNHYLVSEIQWFLSDLKLEREDGKMVEPTDDMAYYIDTDLPESRSIVLSHLPDGNYRALHFTFGLNEENNRSGLFVNPPESFMFWPDYLGGGYHYMKLNGKWINADGLAEPFNFHLGIGQEYDSSALKSSYIRPNDCCAANHCEGYKPPSKMMPVRAFIQNSFEVTLSQNFVVRHGMKTKLEIEMKVENWFRGKHVYDHNRWGGSIMQQQAAMKQGLENGLDVFALHVTSISDVAK